MTPSARTLALVASSAVLSLGVAGCAGSVPAGQVGSTVVTQLKEQGVVVDGGAVTCPEDVRAEVGRSVRCGFTAGGQPVDAVATVSSVDGATVNFDITTEAKPVPKPVLERAVTEQLVRGKVPAERTTCRGDLQPQVGRTQACTASGGGGDILLTTTVTGVRGGLVHFSIADG